jgi:Tol biopolymer transport system component
VGRPELRRLESPPANLLAVSSSGELAVLLRPQVARYGYDRGVLARFPPAGAPRELLEDVEAADWAPDGSDLAVVRKVGSRTRLEFPANRVLFQTTGWISHPRFSPDGRQIAFLNHPSPVEDSGVVMVCDLQGSARALTPQWRQVQGLAWAKGGSEVWFTAAANLPAAHFALRAVGLSGESEGRLVAQVAGDLRLQDVALDGRALVTEPDQRLGLAILNKGDPKPRDFSWFDRTFLGDLSADGRQVLFSVDGPAAGRSSMVYLRKTDGSPPVRLGEGYGVALSPDGRWAISLSLVSGSAQPLVLLPTGPGESRTVEAAGVTAARVRWFPDGQQLLVAGMERDRGMRLYVLGLDNSKPRPISEDGISIAGLAVSRDGAFVAAGDRRGRTTLFPVGGGDAVPLPELEPEDVPFGFADEGSLFVGRLRPLTVPVYRFDLRTRQKVPVATLTADAPGALGIVRVAVTPDGSTFAFNYASVTSNIYLLDRAE